MKIILYVLIFSTLVSCAPKRYLLVLKMEPSTEPGANYENDSLKIHFNVTETFIGVKFENKLDKDIKINWDEISFSLNGSSYARVLHKLTGITKINDVQPTTTIPPHSYIDDKLYPRDKYYVSANRYSGYWSTSLSYFRIKKPNEKSESYMHSRIGNVIVVHMPYYLGNNYVESNFQITIVNVKKIK